MSVDVVSAELTVDPSVRKRQRRMQKRRANITGWTFVGTHRRNRHPRQHHRHRLAGVAHFVDGKYRLIVKRRAVVRLGDQLANILAGVNGEHAGQRARRRHVGLSRAVLRPQSADISPGPGELLQYLFHVNTLVDLAAELDCPLLVYVLEPRKPALFRL